MKIKLAPNMQIKCIEISGTLLLRIYYGKGYSRFVELNDSQL
jgi:hypothetical protein